MNQTVLIVHWFHEHFPFILLCNLLNIRLLKHALLSENKNVCDFLKQQLTHVSGKIDSSFPEYNEQLQSTIDLVDIEFIGLLDDLLHRIENIVR